jgi:3-methyladenine DNA glycosylase/8-oxoguanine DNA glycosylase
MADRVRARLDAGVALTSELSLDALLQRIVEIAAELLAADSQVLRDSGFSARKGETLRVLAERFVDGCLSDEALSRMTDDEVEATLTEMPGIGP